MNSTVVERALQKLGQTLVYHTEVDLLLVGGAAGMVTGVLSPSRTTTDCDVMVCAPAAAMAPVERAAEVVAKDMGLPETWLNGDVQLRLDTLPEDWESRRVFVGAWGQIRVWAASRVDLIAMKVMAGRPQDLDDLRDMRVRRDELVFVNRYLESMAARGTPTQQVEDAQDVFRSLEVHEHE